MIIKNTDKPWQRLAVELALMILKKAVKRTTNEIDDDIVGALELIYKGDK